MARLRPVDAPCMCSHDLTDHIRLDPWTADSATVTLGGACDIDGCPCDEYRDHP